MRIPAELAGELGALISVRLDSRPHADGTSPWDHAWLQARIAVNVSTFKARVDAYLTEGDLLSAISSIRSLLTGSESTARFESIEPWLTLNLERNVRGTIEISGELAEISDGNSLSFRMATDHESLKRFVGTLERELRELSGSKE